ncbi:hypothetical protein Rsub_02843 [Raphidocelis subcapitata]|uniref:Uncharacterized protein n=1 Tax=Raphidocelis subcapitata TaxID=307507 RepID=A0A2V0NVU1_9CHLO|nr:hypothetical protein Rsub_02843 [Raphidocelis subcapitata]|eukprot:GBF89673.1 hypothetical protein Rsub_02843 [Raphidocelis subcapitata]
MAAPRTGRPPVERSITMKIGELSKVTTGGEGTRLLLTERDKPGFLCFRNSYWKVSLFSLNGRAVPWLPLSVYLIYTALVCFGYSKIPGAEAMGQFKELQSVTTTIGVALFLLLSFRNNAAFTRWQNGSDKFKNFCSLGKNMARSVSGTLSSYIAVGGREVAFDVVLERLKWLMVALEIGRQHLRGEKNEEHLLDLLNMDEIEILHRDKDPVLFCLYKVLDMDRMYFVQKCNEWMRGIDHMYMEFCACVNVYTTPIPFAYISHLRTFLVLWLACVPWVYVPNWGYITIALCAVIGYGIIGVEEAAVEVEQPFGQDFNDIPLDSIVAEAYGVIGTYIRIVRDAKRKDLLERANAPSDSPSDDGGKDRKDKDKSKDKEKSKDKDKAVELVQKQRGTKTGAEAADMNDDMGDDMC